MHYAKKIATGLLAGILSSCGVAAMADNAQTPSHVEGHKNGTTYYLYDVQDSCEEGNYLALKYSDDSDDNTYGCWTLNQQNSTLELWWPDRTSTVLVYSDLLSRENSEED